MRQQQQLSPQDWQLLSAYLDGQLSTGDAAKLEQRLRDQAELRAGLDDLKVTRAMLRSVGKQRVPRNFTLTPAMVETARPRPWLRLVPVLNFASAAAALAVVILLVVGLLPGTNLTAAMPAAAPAQTVVVEDTTGQPAPLIWTSPGAYGLGGGASDAAPQDLTAKGMGGGEEGPGFSLPPQVVENSDAAGATQSQPQEPAPTEAPAGVMMIPSMTATPAPAATASAADPALPAAPVPEQPALPEMTQRQVDEDPREELTGSGPILGVRPPGEAQVDNQQVIDQNQPTPVESDRRGSWWITPLALAVFAAGAFLASWLIRRKALS